MDPRELDPIKLRMLVLTIAAVALVPGTVAHAATNCQSAASGSGNAYIATAQCSSTSSPSTPAPAGPRAFDRYEWRPFCGTAPESSIDDICVPLFPCADDQTPSRLFGLRDGDWVPLQVACRGGSESPSLTPAVVATAFQRIPLPALRSISEPGTKTLVNLDTIFHVDATTLDRRITLLGQQVELTVTPSRFRWTFGDGTTRITTTPGQGYPAKTLVHRYLHAPTTVEHHVAITWTATWRVNGGPWRDVPGTVTTTGPTTSLRIAEAVPQLAGADG